MIFLNSTQEPITIERIINASRDYNTKDVVLLENHEWECNFIDKNGVDKLKEHEINLKVVHGAFNDDYYSNCYFKLGLDVNQNAIFWPTFWFNRSDLDLHYRIKHVTYSPPTQFKHYYICMNNRAHVQRCATIEQLAKEQLIDKGVVTWHDFLGENPNYPFKHFDRTNKLILNDNFATELDSFIIPQEFHESFFHLVTEATTTVKFITEKTVTPLLLKKPFAAVAAPNFHAHLVSLGFELYDELIDYSFDSEPDLHKRVAMIVEQLKTILQLDLSTAYETIKDKAERNYNRALEIIYDATLIPDEIKQIEKEHRSNPDLTHIYTWFIDKAKRVETMHIWSTNEQFIEQANNVLKEKDEIDFVLIDSCNELDSAFNDNSSLTECVNLLTKNNIPVKMTIMLDSDVHQDLRDSRISGHWQEVELIEWPMYWINRTFCQMSLHQNIQKNDQKNLKLFSKDVCLDNTHYDFLYVSLNNISKLHRCLMMDQLAKYQLIDSGAIAWRDFVHQDSVYTGPAGNSTNYDFKYWDPKVMLLDQHNVDQRTVLFNQEAMVSEYRYSFMQIVPETDDQNVFISEKTVVPMLFNKPFLVAGAVNHHKTLESFGFKLYDEIFDYSFDSEVDMTVRYDGIAKNLDKIRNSDWLELREKVRDKLVYNRNLALSYVFDKVPEPIKAIDKILTAKQTPKTEFQQYVNLEYIKNELY